MNPGEHQVMARAEERHWWYRGLRDVLARVLSHPRLALPPRPRVLDAGCGTGENLRFLGGLLAPSYLGGFDFSEEAVALARSKAAPGTDVYRADICDPVIHETDLDLLLSLDVIYIPGAEQALPGLRRLVAALRPGGLLILNLPAYGWLFSEHDVAVHTRQRFTARELRRLAEQLDLEVELVTYRLFFLFPLVVLLRLPSILRPTPRDRPARSDLHAPPGRLVNGLLAAVVRFENACIRRGIRFPWGSSVFAVARKPREPGRRPTDFSSRPAGNAV